jgi:hypothetical protein
MFRVEPWAFDSALCEISGRRLQHFKDGHGAFRERAQCGSKAMAGKACIGTGGSCGAEKRMYSQLSA